MGGEAERAAIAIAKWKRSESIDYFDDAVLPLLEEVQEKVGTAGSPEAIAEWLELDAMLGPVSDEDVGYFTLDLIENQPELVSAAQELLTPGAIAGLADAFVQGPFLERREIADDFDHLSVEAAPSIAEFFTTDLPLCAAFAATGRAHNNRGYPIIEGTLALTNRNGQAFETFACTTGGGSSSFQKRGGPLPPGSYIASAFRIRSKPGMVRDGVGYSLNLDPAPGTRVFGRSLFRIHPDGGPRGTLGCLGIEEGGERAREAMSAFRSLAASGNFLVSVDLAEFQ